MSPLAIGWADAVGGVSDANPAAKVLLAIEPARETVRTALAAGFDPGGGAAAVRAGIRRAPVGRAREPQEVRCGTGSTERIRQLRVTAEVQARDALEEMNVVRVVGRPARRRTF